MTDSNVEEPAEGRAEKPEEPELRGRYVKGDYRTAGSDGGLPEPLGEKAREAGRLVKAEYADAGPRRGGPPILR